MPIASFETPDGEDVEIDPEDVVRLSPGEEDGTTVIELQDEEEITVSATNLEVIAYLDLDPLEHMDNDELLGEDEEPDEDS